jgi:hypothetical protein
MPAIPTQFDPASPLSRLTRLDASQTIYSVDDHANPADEALIQARTDVLLASPANEDDRAAPATTLPARRILWIVLAAAAAMAIVITLLRSVGLSSLATAIALAIPIILLGGWPAMTAILNRRTARTHARDQAIAERHDTDHLVPERERMVQQRDNLPDQGA